MFNVNIDQNIPINISGLAESLRLLKPTLLQSKSYPTHRLIRDLITGVELCDDRLGHIFLKYESKTLDETLLRGHKIQKRPWEYPMISKHLRLSLSKGILALVFNHNEKLKKIKGFTHKRVVKAHEDQRLTWLDVCPLTRVKGHTSSHVSL